MRRKKKTPSEINYWQSNTDLLTGLVLVLMLIIMLLILYLIQIPEYDQPDPEAGDSYNVDAEIGDETDDSYEHWDEDSGNRDDSYEHWEDDSGGGGGGGDDGGGDGEGTSDEENEFDEEFPYPTSSGEDWHKAAVYVTVSDAETGRAIREEGITFELYEEQRQGDGGSLRFLNTYYPEKIEYRDFATTEEGVFYLPEKIEEGYYYFRQITDLEGYDPAENAEFTIDDIYDWDEPFVVSVEVSPSKNIIPVTLVDAETQESISGGTFTVTAAETISTADGTVRFSEGDQADTVTLDEDGYGESQELYLGNYTVAQETVPQYYAAALETVDVAVEQKDGGVPETVRFSCEKTAVRLHLSDALYTDADLEGAEFTLECPSDPELTQTAATDAGGELVFTDLEKDTAYILRQTGAPETYRYDDGGTEIYVAKDGRIEGEAEAVYEFTNYVPRVCMDVQDRLFGKPLSDVSLALYNSEDQAIRTWTASGAPQMFEDLPAGSYYVLVDGDENRRYEFEFNEDDTLQEFTIIMWTLQDTAAAAAGGGILILVMIAAGTILRRRKSRKQE